MNRLVFSDGAGASDMQQTVQKTNHSLSGLKCRSLFFEKIQAKLCT
uniref:Uncharacterized protein n=1 Tax=Anguilla anguilla TaxID=7936 RepID=A0A0E9R420_ANGAN